MVEHTDSAVGYKRPPVATQFKPGQSGNPKGRKKGIRNFKTDVRNELDEVITVHEGGRAMKITKQRALVKALVAAAIKGDMRATNALVSFCTKTFGDDEDSWPTTQTDPKDIDLLKEFVDRDAKRRRIKGERT